MIVDRALRAPTERDLCTRSLTCSSSLATSRYLWLVQRPCWRAGEPVGSRHGRDTWTGGTIAMW